MVIRFENKNTGNIIALDTEKKIYKYCGYYSGKILRGKNKKKVADELYSEIKDYEERNGINIKERTTKKLVLDTISECANRIGKYYALCDYWNYF